MANAIKKLTFILVPLTILFFVTTFIAGNAEHAGDSILHSQSAQIYYW